MQVQHSLSITDFYDDNYSLIGVHTTLEDYKFAYLLNKHLKTNLTKTTYNLDFERKKSKPFFSVYNYSNKTYGFDWFLIANSYNDHKKIESSQLLLSTEIKNYLIPEKKKVDFFIKIIGGLEDYFISETIKKINTIHQVITSYSINPNTLKSKEFLIF